MKHLKNFKLFESSTNDILISGFTKAIESNNVELVKHMISKYGDKIDLSFSENIFLRKACMNNNTELVKLLLDQDSVDQKDKNSWAIKVARLFSNDEIVEILENHSTVDPDWEYDIVNELLVLGIVYGDNDTERLMEFDFEYEKSEHLLHENLKVFEIDSVDYAIGTDEEMDAALKYYCDNYLDSVGYEGIHKPENYLNYEEIKEDYIGSDDDYYRETAEDQFEDTVEGIDFQDIVDYIEIIEDDSNDDDERLEALYDLETILDDLDGFNILSKNRNSYEHIIEEIENDDIINTHYISIDQSNLEAYKESLIEDKIEEIKNIDIENFDHDPVGYITDNGFNSDEFYKRYFDEDKFSEELYDELKHDDRGSILSPSGESEYETIIENETYYIIN